MTTERSDRTAGRQRQRPRLRAARGRPPSWSASTAPSPATSSAPIEAGLAPNLRPHAAGAARTCIGACVDPELHQPEQPVDHHRPRRPRVHGIAGNYFYDRDAGKEVMMNDPRFLRAPTIIEGLPGCRRQGRGGHRQGQAARAARQGPRHVAGPRHRASPRRRPTRRRWPRTASSDVLALVGMPLPDVYSRRALASSSSPPASS